MMKWNEEKRQLVMSFQDLEHVLCGYDPENDIDFDEALRGELALGGLDDLIDPEKDINTILIKYHDRTIWAKDTPAKYLKMHKGSILT